MCKKFKVSCTLSGRRMQIAPQLCNSPVNIPVYRIQLGVGRSSCVLHSSCTSAVADCHTPACCCSPPIRHAQLGMEQTSENSNHSELHMPSIYPSKVYAQSQTYVQAFPVRLHAHDIITVVSLRRASLLFYIQCLVSVQEVRASASKLTRHTSPAAYLRYCPASFPALGRCIRDTG